MRYALIAIVLASFAAAACEPMQEVCLKETVPDDVSRPADMADYHLRTYVMGRPFYRYGKPDPTRIQKPGCHFALESAKQNLAKLDEPTRLKVIERWARKAEKDGDREIANTLFELGGIRHGNL